MKEETKTKTEMETYAEIFPMSFRVKKQKQNALVRGNLESKFESESPELRTITNLIISCLPESFSDLKGFVFTMLFTNKQLTEERVGLCRKLEDTVRFKMGIDFIISFYKPTFDTLSRRDKAKIIIHELHHIEKDENGLPKIRRHNEEENFCELASHDLYSESLFLKIQDKLDFKLEEIEEK